MRELVMSGPYNERLFKPFSTNLAIQSKITLNVLAFLGR